MRSHPLSCLHSRASQEHDAIIPWRTIVMAAGKRSVRIPRAMFLLCVAVQGCASVQPPKVDVLQARLSAIGILDQQLQVQLCVRNPNSRELAFSKVTANVAVSGERLTSAANDMPVTLPPLSSVTLPCTVSTTTRNLGDQLGSILGSGELHYTVSGVVVLRDFSIIGIPYSVRGRVKPQMVAGRLIGMAGEPDAPSACGPIAPNFPAAL